ncbi:hypothetical protein NUW58_g4694 [Xylaria curta]|uniref:Uncharacterized protein n=1 Tax=Xylaria curta TaxID=42375 RepID=A0ACC1P6W8_9PEZI|nr:hypothetical protein NUW58_g4694 [Xylaria curta]
MMRTLGSIAFILPLLPLGLSIPHERQVAHEFNLTGLTGTFPTSGVYGTGPIDSSLSITVTYPDASSTNDASLTTTCSYGWPASIGPGPTNWTTCQDSSVQWRLPASNWKSFGNYLVELYQTLTPDGAGLYANHTLTFNPGDRSDPNAYLSCLQMGKFTPTFCRLDGPLSVVRGPVVMSASEETARPN